MEITGMTDLTDIPAGYGGSQKERLQYLLDVSRRIVHQSLTMPDEESIRQAMSGYMATHGEDCYTYCVCGEGVYIDFVYL